MEINLDEVLFFLVLFDWKYSVWIFFKKYLVFKEDFIVILDKNVFREIDIVIKIRGRKFVNR